MRKTSLVVMVALLAVGTTLATAGCAAYHDRYGTTVAFEPEFWGTVSYVDVPNGRIDLDYVGDGGRHFNRSVYYGADARWDGLRDAELHAGDQIVVHGRTENGRFRTEWVRRH